MNKSNSFSNGLEASGPRKMVNRLIEIFHGEFCCCGWCLQGHK